MNALKISLSYSTDIWGGSRYIVCPIRSVLLIQDIKLEDEQYFHPHEVFCQNRPIEKIGIW